MPLGFINIYYGYFYFSFELDPTLIDYKSHITFEFKVTAFGGKLLFQKAFINVNYDCISDSIYLNTYPVSKTDKLASFYQTVDDIPVLFINQSA